jgi:hypothetical protein
MNNWSTLPTEILERILLNVGDLFSKESKGKSIFQRILVCKNRKTTAQKIAYTDIYIRDKKQFIMLKETILQNNLLGRTTNSFEYGDSRRFNLDELLTSLSEMFPFLKSSGR